ncbi:MAG: GHKL domain-containing protein [Alkaliphilus sp.]|nr:GHKL domain-containing protein [Alkaliphilus sp.]
MQPCKLELLKFAGLFFYKDKKLKTTHADKENHGLGLQSVHKSLEKYSASMSLDHTDKIVYVDVLLICLFR